MKHLSILAGLLALLVTAQCVPIGTNGSEHERRLCSACQGGKFQYANLDLKQAEAPSPSANAAETTSHATVATRATAQVFSGNGTQARRIFQEAEIIVTEALNSTGCESLAETDTMTFGNATLLPLPFNQSQAVVLLHGNLTCNSASANSSMGSSFEMHRDLDALRETLKGFFIAQKLALYVIGGVVGTLQIIDFILKVPGLVRSIREQWMAWRAWRV